MTITVVPKHNVTYDGATIAIYHANKGEGLPKHSHSYSHLTVCHAGACVVRKDGRQMVVNKFTQPINLVADEWHEIEALEDGTVFMNVFAEGKV